MIFFGLKALCRSCSTQSSFLAKCTPFFKRSRILGISMYEPGGATKESKFYPQRMRNTILLFELDSQGRGCTNMLCHQRICDFARTTKIVSTSRVGGNQSHCPIQMPLRPIHRVIRKYQLNPNCQPSIQSTPKFFQ